MGQRNIIILNNLLYPFGWFISLYALAYLRYTFTLAIKIAFNVCEKFYGATTSTTMV